jgi:hypothetical protein
MKNKKKIKQLQIQVDELRVSIKKEREFSHWICNQIFALESKVDNELLKEKSI